MDWLEELKNKFDSGASHFFLMYFNVYDEIIVEKKSWKRLHQILAHYPPVKSAKIIAFYNRGTGIRFAKKEMKDHFLKLIGMDDDRGREIFEVEHKKVDFALQRFDEVLHLPPDDPKVLQVFGAAQQNLIAVILEYADTIVPADSAAMQSEADRNRRVLLEWWAGNQEIRDQKNIIILLSERLSQIASPLRAEDRGVIPIRLSLPDYEERLLGINLLRKKHPPQPEDVDSEFLAHLTAGLSQNTILQIIKEATFKKIALTPETVFFRKKKIIEEQSGGLMEIMRPQWGMEAIGDLLPHKRRAFEVIKAMKEKDFLACPMGILLVGPQGTGKTVYAEAMAYEAEIPLVILKNLRSMFVGQSEANLELILELIRALTPVIVFVDEFDQQFQRRGEVYHGDSGVSARMSAQLFAFMGDTSLRGKVLWLAATNRPDLIDQALLRPGRFDEKIPFLPPGVEERFMIFKALLRKMEIQAEILKVPFQYDLSDQVLMEAAKKCVIFKEKRQEGFRLIKQLPPGVKEEDENYEAVDFTGAELEIILLRAYKIAKQKGKEVMDEESLNQAIQDFIPTRDLVSFKEMTDQALLQADSEEFIPEKLRKYAQDLRVYRSKKFLLT
jgi:SpoVK/Ycf46/Vps4 family AAA+-type ATPase